MKADSLLSIEIKPQPPEKFEYKTPIEMDHNDRSKTILKLHTYIWTNRAQPYQPSLQKCQPMHVIQNIFGPNYFFWSALKVPQSDFIRNMSQALSKCLKKGIKVENLIISKMNQSI